MSTAGPKTILITGTTNGIGKVTATELARDGHRICMANRNRQKSEALRDEIIAETGNEKIECLDLDLSSLESVRQCAADFNADYDSLDILINNAGINHQSEVITTDGLEANFQVNALSQLMFTQSLLPALEKAAPSHVIFVTSMMHKFGKLNFDSFQGWDKYSGGASYNQSKLAMMLLAKALGERVKDQGITVSSLHPGAVNTGILDDFSKPAQFLLRLVFVAPEKGAKTSLFLAREKPDTLATGTYYVNSKPARAHKLVDDSSARDKLWDTCKQLTV